MNCVQFKCLIVYDLILFRVFDNGDVSLKYIDDEVVKTVNRKSIFKYEVTYIFYFSGSVCLVGSFFG